MIQFILAILFTIQAQAQILETPDLDKCLSAASTASAHQPSSDVIYVFDIDNTVLRLQQNLGSVQWFRWQQKLIQDNIAQDRVAATIDELLTIQGHIYKLSRSQKPEPDMANKLLELQRGGHPLLFHTSRNIDVRDTTERELRINGLAPVQNTIGPIKGYAGNFVYSDGPENQRPATFQNGIYMTAGQDKGIWLNLLFLKTSRTFKHLVFVDDEIKNLQNVERAFKDKISMTLCRYGKVDETVREFNQSNKSTEINLWNDLQGIISKLN